MSDLDAARLQVAFRQSRFLKHFFFYPSINSTNEKAKELAVRGAEEGTLVIADRQTEGRGRSGRHWFSPPELGLYVSVIFRPRIQLQSAFGMHMAVALAAAEATDTVRTQGMMGIKWPNDLVAEGRKVAGVLTELGVQGGELDWCVVGIGLNVNHSMADFPGHPSSRHLPAGTEPATSGSDRTPGAHDRGVRRVVRPFPRGWNGCAHPGMAPSLHHSRA